MALLKALAADKHCAFEADAFDWPCTVCRGRGWRGMGLVKPSASYANVISSISFQLCCKHRSDQLTTMLRVTALNPAVIIGKAPKFTRRRGDNALHWVPVKFVIKPGKTERRRGKQV